MARITSGLFTTQDEADRTSEALLADGFAADDICKFFNNAPGQHAELPTGGDEAAIWAGDLYRMLTRFAERRGFKHEALQIDDGDYTFAIRGDGAYSVFKFEGGTHRVQRVPET